MPGMSGLEVARTASGRCHVVFVTAYDKYAVEAFEQGAVDYVMKPFSPLRLEATVERLKARLHEPPADLNGILQAITTSLGKRKEYLRWITASHTDGLRLITVDSICYFRADNKYTAVVTGDSESLIRRPLKTLIEEVDPQVFWQIHRSVVVNVNMIAGVVRDARGHLQVRLKGRKETLPVGRILRAVCSSRCSQPGLPHPPMPTSVSRRVSQHMDEARSGARPTKGLADAADLHSALAVYRGNSPRNHGWSKPIAYALHRSIALGPRILRSVETCTCRLPPRQHATLAQQLCFRDEIAASRPAAAARRRRVAPLRPARHLRAIVARLVER